MAATGTVDPNKGTLVPTAQQQEQAQIRAGGTPSTPTTKKKSGGALTPSADTQGQPPAGTSAKKNIGGIPMDTQIRVGVDPKTGKAVFSKPQYSADSVYITVANMSNQDKINTLKMLGAIPGAYAKNKAPTSALISGQGLAVSFRAEDYAALGQVMAHADSVGQSYTASLAQFATNPALAGAYFGVPTGTKINTSSPDALKAEITSRFQDAFDTIPDKKTADAYAKEVNKAELKAGGAISAQQKEDIFLKYVTATANERFKTAEVSTDPNAKATLEHGALGQTVRLIRSAYADNGIPASDKQIYNEAIQGTRSAQALKNITDNINMQAALHFPAFKDVLAQGGKTVKDVVAPYMTLKSQILGVPTEQLKVSDFYDVGSGPAPMSLTDFKMKLYQDPLYKKTADYQQKTFNDMQTLISSLGLGPV